MNLEQNIINHCAPTLAGIKSANLFTTKFFSKENFNLHIENWNNSLKEKGVTLKVLKYSGELALVYLYRLDMLEIELHQAKAHIILNKYGYKDLTALQSIERLSDRICSTEEFPHEIGLFLSYPPEDVEGFICNKGQNCNLCGYWKVYGDTKEALSKFARFDKCRMIYNKLWNEGRDILCMTVKKRSQIA